jgi:hypothetical protein
MTRQAARADSSPSLKRLRLFVSHSSADAELARGLQRELDQWFLGTVESFNSSERGSLAPGDPWLEEIESNLRSADALIALMTPAGLRSPWVNFEAGAVWLREGSTVIPCCAGQSRKGSLPPPYSYLQALDLDAAADIESLFELISKLCGLACPQAPFDEVAERLATLAQLSVPEEQGNADRDAFGNRVEKRLEIEWRYARSTTNPRRWAAFYSHRVEFEVTAPDLQYIEVDFSPSVQTVGFTAEHPPHVWVEAKERSSPGSVRLGEPHHRTGSKFSFRIHFEPPLLRGHTALVHTRVEFPEYRVGIRDDLVADLLAAGAEVRDYDYNSRTMVRPNELLVYRVILPQALGATPWGPEVRRNAGPFVDEQRFVDEEPGVFTVTETTDDDPSWVMELRRTTPPFRASYRLRWRLPRLVDLPDQPG